MLEERREGLSLRVFGRSTANFLRTLTLLVGVCYTNLRALAYMKHDRKSPNVGAPQGH